MTFPIVTDELLARFFAGEATPEEAMLVEDWQEGSAANQNYFDEVAQIFSRQRPIAGNKETLEAWQSLKEVMGKQEGTKSIRLMRWRVGTIAAVAVLVIAISLIIFRVPEKRAAESVYRTGEEQKKIWLPDSSEITLAAHSTVTISQEFGKVDRHISLQGSAFFVVKHDPVRPLIIDMNKLYVEDIGTQFYINATLNNDTVFVYVHEGEAAFFDDAGSKLVLKQGQKAWYVRSLKQLTIVQNKQTVTKTNATKTDSLRKVDKDWDHLIRKLCDTCKTRLPEKAVPADSARTTIEPAPAKPPKTARPAKPGNE